MALLNWLFIASGLVDELIRLHLEEATALIYSVKSIVQSER